MIDLKLVIGAGHCEARKVASGAYYQGWHESTINRQVTNELIKLLQKKSHSVVNATINKAGSQTDYLKKVCKIVNDNNCDLFIQIHCNMSNNHNASGCEVWTWQGKKYKEAVNICSNMEKLGFKNRKIKDGSSLYVIKRTKPIALLVELFFMDSQVDRALYTKHGAKKLAQAIADSI